MTLVSAGELVGTGQAVAAFNVITIEHAEAIAAGAESAGRGSILQISENAIRFHGSHRPLLAACREIAAAASVPLALHLDHIASSELAETAIQDAMAGSIMIDASVLPYAANVEQTARLTRQAHAAGLWVEAELGAVGGKDGAHAPGVRTDPGEAAAFVEATGVDALAVAVGSSHAMSSQTASLDLDLIARLASAVPVPLVLHGSSGVPDDALRSAVAAGIRKVNIGTALNVAGTSALRAELGSDVVDPRAALAAQRTAMAHVVEHYVQLLA